MEENNNPISEDKDIKDNKAIAVLSYIGILCLVPLLLKRDSNFVKFHSKQGLVLCIGWLVVWFPLIGWLLGVALFVYSIFGIINVMDGKYAKLPIVGDLAEKFNI